MLKKIFFLCFIFQALAIFGAKLENQTLHLLTDKSTIKKLTHKKQKLFSFCTLMLQKKGQALFFNSGPSQVTRTSKGDLWFLDFAGTMKQKKEPVLSYEGKMILRGENIFDYKIEGEFLKPFKGSFALISWLDFKLLKGCKFEYFYKNKWQRGILPSKPGSFVKTGWTAMKIVTNKGFSIIITTVDGNAKLMRWKTKNPNQPFRLDFVIPRKNYFAEGERFKLAFQVKVENEKQLTGQTATRSSITGAVFRSEAYSNIISLNLTDLKGKIDYNGLSNIKVTDSNKILLPSQIEDRNLNGIIDPADLLVFRSKLPQNKWSQLTLSPQYTKVSPTFETLEANSFKNNQFQFIKKSNALYQIKFNKYKAINLKVSISDGLRPPVASGYEYLKPGLYFTEGLVRTRISNVLITPNGLPMIKAFVFDHATSSVTYSCATFAFTGWGKHYVSIPLTDAYKNATKVIAYGNSKVNFLKSSFKGKAWSYGDWLAGWYSPDFQQGISIASMNEIQNYNAWAPNSSVRTNKLSQFYPSIPSSFTGKVQVSFVDDKKGFQAALKRSKSIYRWDFNKTTKELNEKLISAKCKSQELSQTSKSLLKKIQVLNNSKLYSSAAKIKIEMCKVYQEAAENALKLGRAKQYETQIAKAFAKLAQAQKIIKTVLTKKIILPLPPVNTKFHLGVCTGYVGLNTKFNDFNEFLDPAFYTPLKTVGLKDIQFHSFPMGNPIKDISDWIRMLKKNNLNAFPQLNLHFMPKSNAEKFPYYARWLNNWRQCYNIRPFSPRYMKGFKQTNELTQIIKNYYKTISSKLTAAGADGFFAINEPTVRAIGYTDKMKPAFLYGFKNYLKEKYSKIQTLNEEWDSNFSSFATVEWDNSWLNQKTKSVQSFNDNWTFIADPENSGMNKQWFKKAPANCREIKVPSSWEKQFHELKNYNGFAWYFKKIHLPTGKYIINFQAVDDNAEIFFNGEKIASNIGYDKAFSVTINSIGTKGLLAVRVEDLRGGGGIYRSVELSNAKKIPYLSILQYPGRCADYYDFRHQVLADFIDLQTSAIKTAAPEKFVAVKEWTSNLSYERFINYCDPYYIAGTNKGKYVAWDQYTTSNTFMAYQAAIRQSISYNKSSIIGEYGLNGGGNCTCQIGSAAIQNAMTRSLRLLGRNVRGIFFFSYSNNHTCGLLDRDYNIPERLIKMGEFSRTIKNTQGLFDSLIPFGELGIYFSRNDAYMSKKNLAYNQVYSLFSMFYQNNLNPVIVDSMTMHKYSKKLKVIIVPSAPFISKQEWKKIEQFRKNGGTVLTYANTGLMNKNNTLRRKSLLPQAAFTGFDNVIKISNSPLSRDYQFGMKVRYKTSILTSDNNNTLIGETVKRLYVSNLDIGRIYSDFGKKNGKTFWQTMKNILKKANVFIPIQANREVQYLCNKSGDVFVFIPASCSKTENIKFRVDTTHLKKIVSGKVIYDYLNLRKANIKQKDNFLYFSINKFGKNEEAIWWIGRKK